MIVTCLGEWEPMTVMKQNLARRQSSPPLKSLLSVVPDDFVEFAQTVCTIVCTTICSLYNCEIV